MKIGDTFAIDRCTAEFTVTAVTSVTEKVTCGHVDAVYVTLSDWQLVANLNSDEGALIASSVAI